MKKDTCLDWVRLFIEIIVVALLFYNLKAANESNIISTNTMKQIEMDSKDRYLTGVWNDIMRESILYPEFNDKSRTLYYKDKFSSEEIQKYEIYVRWVGGFIEDLYSKQYVKENWLYYDPWIKDMLDIHSTWFIEHIHFYINTPDFYSELKNLALKASDNMIKK